MENYSINTAHDVYSTFIKPLTGLQLCEACAIGTEANSSRTACISCTTGLTYRSLQTQTSCLPCPANSNCTAIGFSCLVNYKLNSTGNGCEMCPITNRTRVQSSKNCMRFMCFWFDVSFIFKTSWMSIMST